MYLSLAVVIFGATPLNKQKKEIQEAHDATEQELQKITEDLNKAFRHKNTPNAPNQPDYHLHLGFLSAYDTRNEVKLKPDVNLKLVLPGFRERFRLLFNSSDRFDQDGPFDHFDDSAEARTEKLGIGTKGIGLEFELLNQKHYQLVIQEYLKINLDDWPDPTTRLLFEFQKKFQRVLFNFHIGPHWDPSDGFGAILEPNIKYQLQKDQILDFYSTLQWWYQHRFSKEESLSLIGAITQRSAVFVNLRFEYEVSPYQSKDLTYSIGYRRRLYFPWLIGQLTPSLILDGQKEWALVYRFAVGLQVSFGSQQPNMTNFLNF